MVPLPRLEAFRAIDVKVAMSILLHCTNAKMQYVFRTTRDWERTIPLARSFDDSMTQTIAALLTVVHTELFQYRCFLPRDLGGLGIDRQAGMRTECGQSQSRLAFSEYLQVHYHSEFNRLTQPNYWSEIRVGTIEGITQAVDIDEQQYNGLTSKSC